MRFLLIAITFFTVLTFRSATASAVEPCDKLLRQTQAQKLLSENDNENSISRVSAALITGSNSTSLYEYDVVTFRSDMNGEGLPDRWSEKSLTPCWHRASSNLITSVRRESAVLLRDESYSRLYQAYNCQGPERSSLISSFMAEDRMRAKNTTQILIVSNDEVIARIQVQLATHSNDTVNVESHFSTATRYLRPTSDTPVVELGRLIILQPNEVRSEHNKELLTGRTNRSRIFDLIWSNVADQLLKLPKHTVVAFQVSEKVLNRLEHGFAPLKLSAKLGVRSDPQFPMEWLVKMNMQEISKLQTIMVKKRVLKDIVSFLNSSADEIRISVEPGESQAMEALGVYRASRDYTLDKDRAMISRTLGVNFDYPPAFFEIYNRVDQLHRTGSHSVLIGRAKAQTLLNSIEH